MAADDDDEGSDNDDDESLHCDIVTVVILRRMVERRIGLMIDLFNILIKCNRVEWGVVSN
jgi:hypothetical protein